MAADWASWRGAGQRGASPETNLPPGFLSRFIDNVADSMSTMTKAGRDPILITRASLRPLLAEALTTSIPGAVVVSYPETAPATRVETMARITVPGVAGAQNVHHAAAPHA